MRKLGRKWSAVEPPGDMGHGWGVRRREGEQGGTGGLDGGQ